MDYDETKHTQLFILFREILDGLHQRGFKTNMGYNDAGAFLTAWVRAGGYYVGMNQRKYNDKALTCTRYRSKPIHH